MKPSITYTLDGKKRDVSQLGPDMCDAAALVAIDQLQSAIESVSEKSDFGDCSVEISYSQKDDAVDFVVTGSTDEMREALKAQILNTIENPGS